MATALGFFSLTIGLVIVAIVAMRNRPLAGPLLVGFFLRAALAVVDALVRELPGHSDSLHFDFFAYYWARSGFAATLGHIQTGADLYTWVIAVFYSLFGRSTLMMQGVNVLFGTLIILLVARLASLLGRDAARGVRAAWIVAVFPSCLYFSAVLLREIAVTFPLCLGVLYLARWYHERKSTQMIAAVASLLASMAFHSGSVAVFLVVGIWLVINWVRTIVKGFRGFGRSTLALVLGIVTVVAVFSSGFGMDKFQHVEKGGITQLTREQEDFAQGRTAYLPDLHPDSDLDLTWQTPLRLVYFLFAPFPWMIRAVPDIVGIIDSGLFFGLFVRIWRQRRLVAKRRDAVLVLAAFGALATTFAVGVSNYGTATRHRNKMLPLLIATGMSLPSRRRGSSVLRRRAGSRAVPAPP